MRHIILLRSLFVRLRNSDALFALIWSCAENCFCAFLKCFLWKVGFSAVGRLLMRNHPIDFQFICLRQNFMERAYAFAHENLFALKNFLFVFSSKYCSATKFYLLHISYLTIYSKNSCDPLKWKNFTMRSYRMYRKSLFSKKPLRRSETEF